MAKKTEGKEAEPVKDEGRPLTARELVEAALAEPLLRGVPTLLGPSGGGKTWLVQQMHAERHPKGVLVTIVPATESGDELAGIPLRPEKAGQGIEWSLPLCIPPALLKHGGTIFIDELDKAAPDVWPVLLRLLAERKLRDTAIPETVDVVCAANSPQLPLPDPLVGRLFWIRFPEPADHALSSDPALRAVPAAILSRLETQQGKAVTETRYPLIPPSRRAAHRLASWMGWKSLWEANRAGKQRVLAGVLPAQDVPEALAALESHTALSCVEPVLKFVKTQTPASILAAWPDLVWQLSGEEAMQVYAALEERVQADKSGEMQKLWDRVTDIAVVSGIGATREQQALLRKKWLEGKK